MTQTTQQRQTAWLPGLNFVTLHYVYIILMSILSLVILYPAGNLKAIDAYFFGASASTESGLNTVDVKDLYTYQQLYIYFIPVFTNLGFINAIVALVRFLLFRKHLNKVAPRLLTARHPPSALPNSKDTDVEAVCDNINEHDNETVTIGISKKYARDDSDDEESVTKTLPERSRTITFDPPVGKNEQGDGTLYIPGPRERERGLPLVEISKQSSRNARDDLSINAAPPHRYATDFRRRRHDNGPKLEETRTMDRVVSVASSIFVLGSDPTRRRRNSASTSVSLQRETDTKNMFALSKHATLGRNSEFSNLTREDREKLGGIEYRSLKLLVKVVFAYFFGLHIFGAICLVGWIRYCDPKYRDVLAQSAQNPTWWAFYSAQTMIDNLGFTLTPDSMVSFRDAQWPMFIMSFLAFAGNTLYPVFLRLIIWTMYNLAPTKSSIREPLSFLLDHPRRCYTLLFPSRPTWILFGIIFSLNFIDTLLIIVLDLDNPEVASLPLGPRILAAIFQAASSRHTGTSTFNLANVNPGVQFSLLVMMYIAIFPIAISIRASNTYEERSLGLYEQERKLNETNGKDYILTHMRNQLSFDLWFIFVGVFCICIAEARRIVDNSIPSFTVWTVLFEVTSAYGNVGLSLGYPDVATSLSGVFGVFSKLVICAMMIRGRHRGLPYALDKAIVLPDQGVLTADSDSGDDDGKQQ
ncbi:cation transport protein domain-containing protein [Pochonia chlamydosporia 170]|uniref:Cation transport protein domain-containing protein n=1 Tax=Pochonia chlamydosporia 170 TaxID=1380566 RepID=A0A179F651_METCM|nr:cation transport protein domain-containing protein [Pochonia chlamydosporia 170]OAQ60915.1 cation transport protein domain-containing protein [Pochonia chlamydosporia 170]